MNENNMRRRPHLQAAHQAWKSIVRPGDTVIDATCGNGHDALILAQLALTPQSGTLFAMDIQSQALVSAQQRLRAGLTPECLSRVKFIQSCHSKFPDEILPNSVKLVVYNLGYLPGGDKTITTKKDSSLASLKSALELLAPGGMICMTLYPGHSEGKEEEDLLLPYIASLDARLWLCQHQRWINRLNAPSLIFVEKEMILHLAH